jgi:hypothetical protein
MTTIMIWLGVKKKANIFHVPIIFLICGFDGMGLGEAPTSFKLIKQIKPKSLPYKRNKQK